MSTTSSRKTNENALLGAVVLIQRLSLEGIQSEMTLRDILILFCISRVNGLSVGNIVLMLGTAGSSVSQQVKTLKRKGYLTSSRNRPEEGDERLVTIKLTPKGIGIVRKVENLVTEVMNFMPQIEGTATKDALIGNFH